MNPGRPRDSKVKAARVNPRFLIGQSGAALRRDAEAEQAGMASLHANGGLGAPFEVFGRLSSKKSGKGVERGSFSPQVLAEIKMRPDNLERSSLSSLSRQMGESPLKNPADLFRLEQVVKICAPMVRYSKLSFRTLVRKYNCDLCYTPMIVAADFVISVKARHSEFTTNQGDRPLIVQFAAKEAQVLADAAGLVSPFADGIDLNCGCPQRWAMAEGYGACLINKPELVQEMVRSVRNRVEKPTFSVSVKIRIHEDLKRTVDLCQKAESAGVSWITVHGRNVEERHQPVRYDAIKTIKDSVSIPVVANGDVKSLKDVESIHERTGADGVMVARGLLANPALFAGYEDTPLQCVQDWVDIALQQGTPFTCFHHHLMYMLERVTSKQEKKIFNGLSSTSAVLDYLRDNYGVR